MSDILKQNGNEAFQNKDYNEADKIYMNAITLDPTNAVLYSNRAMALIKLKNWKDCKEVCAEGLKQHTDSKTKMKLLWRQGTALMNLKEFDKAKIMYSKALSIDANNQSVLKSIDELKSKESQFKRSYSIDENVKGKRPKTSTETVKREKIPIVEVDELPIDFQIHSLEKKYLTQTKSTILPKTNLSKKHQELEIEDSTKPLNKTFVVPLYPETPSIYQLSTIIKTKDSTKSHALRYVFNIDPETYTRLFAGGSIDDQFLNFFLESILFNLKEKSDSKSFQKARNLLNTFSRFPRFSLFQFSIDKEKLNELKTILGNKDESLSTWIL